MRGCNKLGIWHRLDDVMTCCVSGFALHCVGHDASTVGRAGVFRFQLYRAMHASLTV
jgi:hypothetical protein